MANARVCDICKKPNQIVAKLYLSPTIKPEDGKPKHGWELSTTISSYSAHMDVCAQCLSKVKEFGNWQRRKIRPKMTK